MSKSNRRAFRPKSVFQDIHQSDQFRRDEITVLREYDRSTPWIDIGDAGAPAFGNSWEHYGGAYVPARFMRDAAGIVHVQGLIKNAFNATSGYIFILPEGFRPIYTLTFHQMMYSAAAYWPVEMQVAWNGNIIAYYNSGASNLWTTLSGISFPAEQ